MAAPTHKKNLSKMLTTKGPNQAKGGNAVPKKIDLTPVAQREIAPMAVPDSQTVSVRNHKAYEEWLEYSQMRIDTTASPEDLCGISADMPKSDIKQILSYLYRRHNRAASSLDSVLREEAEVMLDAIVRCRQKYIEGVEALTEVETEPKNKA
jgi:hypothetical protein